METNKKLNIKSITEILIDLLQEMKAINEIGFHPDGLKIALHTKKYQIDLFIDTLQKEINNIIE